MTSYSSRPYAGAADLRQMQEAVARAHAITSLRVGDLAWLSRYHTHRELARDIRLWEGGAEKVTGFTFFRARGGFNVFVAPGCAEDALLDEMLTVIDDIARASVAAGDPAIGLYTYGLDLSRSAEDRALAAALERHGFTAVSSMGGVTMRPLDDLPVPVVPSGYRPGWLQTREQMVGRVAAQQAAFAPSDLTVERYERVQQRWPYRPCLDGIIVTDDGTVVAFCTAWLDEENAAGVLGLVGTHPAHQRRGLAKAVCLDALHALRKAGAATAQVGFESEAGYATYHAIGFEYAAADAVYRPEPALTG